jgi:hypothetical protein
MELKKGDVENELFAKQGVQLMRNVMPWGYPKSNKTTDMTVP